MVFWNIIIGIASFFLNLVLAPKPQNAKPAALEDFNIPVATEGLEIPVLFGTAHLKSPNCVWYGDFSYQDIKGPRRYGLFGPRQVTGHSYFLGMHLVLCHGVHDHIAEIWAGDKLIWEGESSGTGIILIEALDVFGGEEREGGIYGFVTIYDGSPDQTQDSYLATHMAGADTPAFRGVVSVVWDHIYVGTTPYIKPWEFVVQRIHKKSTGVEQWYDAKAAIPRGGPPRWYEIPGGHFVDPDAPGTRRPVAVDMVNTTIVRAGPTALTLEFWSIEGGNLINTVSVDYEIKYLVASRPTDEILVWGMDGDIRVYDAVTGAFKEQVVGVGDYETSIYNRSFCAGVRAVDGVTYLIQTHLVHMYCYANDGGGWIKLWGVFRGFYFGGSFNSIAMSDDLLYCTHGDGHIHLYEWSGIGLGANWYAPKWSYDPPLGIGAGQITPGYYGIQYIDEHDCVILIVYGGYIYKLNHDCSLQLEVVTDGQWNSGPVFGDYRQSNALQSGPNELTFQTWNIPQTGDRIHKYSITPLQLISSYLNTYWAGNPTFTTTRSIASKLIDAVLLTGNEFTGGPIDRVYFFGAVYDMNPSHIIRECLTDTLWGMGYAAADIDDASFTAAADVLYSEGFGLTLLWSREEKIEEFISVVLSHIDAYLYLKRTTGKFYLKLIRNDYDINTIPVFDEDDIVSWDEVAKRSPAEAINSVIVRYTDRLNRGLEASLSFDNIAQIQALGERISATRFYPGISRGALATQVAARDQRSLGIGMISGRFTGKRTLDVLYPGDPFRLTSSRHGLDGEVMRAVMLRFGDGRSNQIELRFVQDVFRLGAEDLIDASQGDWENPANPPAAVVPRLVWEMPYSQVIETIGPTDTATLLVTDSDAGMLQASGAKPSSDALGAEIWVDGVQQESMTFAPAGLLDADIGAFDTAIALTDGSDLDLIVVGQLAAIVGATSETTEIIRIDAVDGNDLTISRGMLDTIPQAHALGDAVIVFDDFGMSDFEARTAGDTPTVELRTRTLLGLLSSSLAPNDEVTLDSRAVRPLRPANVTVEGEYEGPIDGTLLTDFDVAWAERNRLAEITTFQDWTAATVAPEAGQTTVVEVLASDGITVLETYPGLTGLSTTVPATAFDTEYAGWIRVGAERDGYREWQAYKVRVLLAASLLLSGDQQTGTDHVALSGDQAPGNEHLS